MRSPLKCQRDNEVGDAQTILRVLLLNTQCHYSFSLPPDGKDVGIEISLTFALIQLHSSEIYLSQSAMVMVYLFQINLKIHESSNVEFPVLFINNRGDIVEKRIHLRPLNSRYGRSCRICKVDSVFPGTRNWSVNIPAVLWTQFVLQESVLVSGLPICVLMAYTWPEFL